MQIANITTQTVNEDKNVLFSDTLISPVKCITHREGSGVVTLRGITNQCKARFKVSYNANIDIPSGGTVGAISLALTYNGEQLGETLATVTPAAVLELYNVSATTFIDVLKGCCVTVTLQNASTQAIEVSNASLIVERTA